MTGNAFAADVANQSQYDSALTAGGAITATSSFAINAMPAYPIGSNVTLSGVLANPEDPLKVLNGGGGAYHAFTNFDSSFSLTLLENLAIENFGSVAIYNLGLGIPGLSINNARFVNNVNAASLDSGGAVVAQKMGKVTNSTFIGNKANNPGNPGAGGGAFAVYTEMLGSITGSTFTNNLANGEGGAVAVYGTLWDGIDNSTFTGNVAGSEGGALYASEILDDIKNSRFINNAAKDGGALWLSGDLLIRNSVFLGNTASASGGALLHRGDGFFPSLTLEADAGAETVFYANRDGKGYNAFHLRDAGSRVSVRVEGAGKVVMLDPMSADSTLKTHFYVTGNWLLGGENSLDGESTWNVGYGGTLLLTDVRYGAGNPVQPAAIKLNHANSDFYVATGGTLGGSGSIKANSFTLWGRISPSSSTVTGPLVADINGKTNFDSDGSTENSPFGTLRLEGDVRMDGASVVVNVSASDHSKLDIIGDLSLDGFDSQVVLNVLDDTVGAISDLAVVNVTGTITQNTALSVATHDFLKPSGQSATVVGKELKVSMAAPTLMWQDTTQSGGKYDAHGTFDLAAGTSFTVTTALANHANTDPSQSHQAWDGKTLTKQGEGTLILNAANTYTGDTKVEAGTLYVGSVADSPASVAGNVTVAAGATLGGHGTLGSLTAAADAKVAPGTKGSTGTLNVAGHVDLGGARLDIKVNPDGSSDKLAASGTAKIANAALAIYSGGGSGVWAANTTYTILEAAGGLGGEQFDASKVTNNLAFLDYALNYANPNQVQLTMTRNDASFTSFAGTPNQHSAASAIAALDNAHAVNLAVTGLSAAEAASAYNNLSGEIYGSVRSALLGNTRLRSTAQARMRSLGAQALSSAPVLLASNGTLPRASLNTPSQRLWANTWAYDGQTDGSRNAAKTDQSGIGLALGGDVRVADAVTVGALFGYEDGKVKNSGDRRSRTDVDAYSLGSYATADLGGIDLQGGLLYSRMKLDTHRTITVPGLAGKARASYKGYQVQAFLEAGLPLELGEATITPYANLTQTWLHTDAAREKGSAAALRTGAQNDSVAQTTLGVRAAYQLPTVAPVALTAHLGWVHAFGDTQAKTSNRFGSAGNRFAIEGKRMDRDRALIGLGFEAQLAPNTTVAAGYDGQFGSNTKEHAGSVQVRVRF